MCNKQLSYHEALKFIVGVFPYVDIITQYEILSLQKFYKDDIIIYFWYNKFKNFSYRLAYYKYKDNVRLLKFLYETDDFKNEKLPYGLESEIKDAQILANIEDIIYYV